MIRRNFSTFQTFRLQEGFPGKNAQIFLYCGSKAGFLMFVPCHVIRHIGKPVKTTIPLIRESSINLAYIAINNK